MGLSDIQKYWTKKFTHKYVNLSGARLMTEFFHRWIAPETAKVWRLVLMLSKFLNPTF